MGLTLVTPPSTWPVTLDEARAQCRVTATDENAYIEGLIRSATTYIEATLSRSLATRTWKLTLDKFTDAIELPRGPVQSVTSVKYYDADGVEQTLGAGFYTADIVSDRPWVVLNSGQTWPTTLNGINAVSITYTAGMGDVPDDLMHAILLLVGSWFATREAVVSERGVVPVEVPFAVDALLQSYRWVLV